MSIIPETIWHDLTPYLGPGFGEEAYIRKMLYDNQRIQLDKEKAHNERMREAVEAANKFATHFLDIPKEIYWSDLQNLLDELEAALEKGESDDNST
jgi:hypothetical protein